MEAMPACVRPCPAPWCSFSVVLAWQSRMHLLSAKAEGYFYAECSVHIFKAENACWTWRVMPDPLSLSSSTAEVLVAKLNTSPRRNISVSICSSYTSYVEAMRTNIVSADLSSWQAVCFLYLLVDTPVWIRLIISWFLLLHWLNLCWL